MPPERSRVELLELIPEGHENTITRSELATLTGLSDRKIRKAIENYTRAGNIIVNLDDGYFRYSGKEDIPYLESYYRREMARGWSIINKCRIIRKYLILRKPPKEDDQMNLFDFLKDRNI